MDMTPLIDERVVAQTFALRRQVVRPQPRGPGKIVQPGQAYGSVLRGPEGEWKMWYLAQPQYCEYFAASSDGVVWRRPALELVSPDIRPRTEGPNAFLAPGQTDAAGRWLVHIKGPEGFCVLDSALTPHPAARERYTAMYLARANVDGRWINGLHLAHSDDGICWLADERNPVIEGWRDTANVFFYDPRIGRYVWYGRPEAHVATGRSANRLIARAESQDMAHWEAERTVLDTDDLDADPMDLVDELAFRGLPEGSDGLARARAAGELTEATAGGADAPLIRGRNRQWYGITVFPHAGLYLALGWMYDVPSGEIWIELLHSYDGIDWRRETNRKPFLPCPAGDIRLSMSSPPVEVGDELWIYSSTRGKNHHGRTAPDGEQGIEVHAIKRDRWVAYAAGEREGELLTQPLPRANRVALNARTSVGGSIRTAVLDAAGREINGFTLLDSDPLVGDGLAMQPTWSNARGAGEIPAHNRTVRLRVVLRRAELFALQV
jgi:hypothetical protein